MRECLLKHSSLDTEFPQYTMLSVKQYTGEKKVSLWVYRSRRRVALSFRISTLIRSHHDRFEKSIEVWRWSFENRELCLYHPGKMKIISIQSDTELLSLSRPYSSVYVERKTFMWVTIQGVKIQREKKKYIPFSVSWIHSQTLQDTYARTSEIEKISERVLRDSNVLYLPTQHTYVPQTPPTSFIYVYAKSVKSWGVHRMCGVGFRTLAPSGACVWKCFFFRVDLCVANLYDLIWKIWN